MMHRFFLPAVAGLALALAVSAPAEAAGGGGIGGGGRGMSLGGGGFGHAGLGGSLGGGGLSHGGLGAGAGSFGRAGLGVGIGGVGTGAGAVSYGLGGSRAPIGPSLTKGIGTPGGDDLHLGLSSHDLGLGNNFGLDAPDNVLSRAARVGNPPIISGIGRQANIAQRRSDGRAAKRLATASKRFTPHAFPPRATCSAD